MFVFLVVDMKNHSCIKLHISDKNEWVVCNIPR
jgi:hypothetical protein